MKIIKKKTILAFAMSMIFSLATLQGMSQKNVQQQDMNLQQAGAACIYIASKAKAGTTGKELFNYIGYTFSGVSIAMTSAGLFAIWVTFNPVGAAYWICDGMFFL